jgi:arylsulfatase A-like enzyme
VFVLADDLGWADVGFQGSKYHETPHIDRLARQGLRFSSYYVSPVCSPTRAALMTGQYGPRTGIYTVPLPPPPGVQRKMKAPGTRMNLTAEKVTIAQALKDAGYATGMFGKWHLGDTGGNHPSRRGFDQAIIADRTHYDFKPIPPVDVPPGTYLADFLTDQALRFIDENRARPFFLYLPHFAVHVPHQAKPELRARFEKKAPVGGQGNPTYAAMIASLDESVGRIVGRLDELGLAKDTVLIFSSDNGGVHARVMPGVTSNAPLRLGKGTAYEGGIRVPFVVRWPGVVPAGAVTDEVAAHVDLFPTLLEIAGARAPAGQTLDGVSLLPVLKRPTAKLGRKAIYLHYPVYINDTTPVGMVRAGDFKLLEFFEDGRLELYDIRHDIGETTDLSTRMPGKAAELREWLRQWRKDLGAAMPVPN